MRIPVSSVCLSQEQDTRFEGWVQLKENGKHQKRYFVLAGTRGAEGSR